MSAVEQFVGFDIPAIESGQALMMYMTPEDGDVRKIWDRAKPDEVEDARRSFESLTKKGYRAYRVKNDKGEAGERMADFDSQAEKMILIPQMMGG
jgi:hypothetical protein